MRHIDLDQLGNRIVLRLLTSLAGYLTARLTSQVYSSSHPETSLILTNMTSHKYARDVEEGDQIMMRSCPVLVQRVLGPAQLDRDEYFFTGNDIIDGREYGQSFQPNDLVALADVKYQDKRVVCARFQTLWPYIANSSRDRKRHL